MVSSAIHPRGDVSMRLSATFALAAVLFFLSGALGLGYELVWIHKASLLVGATQIALATVLTSFFLGLGLGSLFVGRYLRSRRWSPLFVYGLFEIAIGCFALVFPALFDGVEVVYSALYPLFDAFGSGLFVLRFGLLFILFLVPTFFMGGTLPLLLDGLVARDRVIGALTSFLYGLNILGAVAGVLATSYFAIPGLGMSGTSQVAGFCNLAIGVVALVAFRGLAPLHRPAGAAPAPPGVYFAGLSFVSGLAAIGYQVLWARYFSLFSQANVHVTAVLLTTFLAALAVGSMVLAPVLRSRIHPLRILIYLQPLVPILAFTCFELWRFARFDFKILDDFEAVPRWSFWSETVDVIFIAPLIGVSLVIFLPVALLGTGLPVIIAAATDKAGALRSTAGSLVFFNTLGSSAGGFAAGYILLPGLGLTGAFAVLAVVSVGISVAAQWRLGLDAGLTRRRFLQPGYVPAIVALLFVGVWSQDDVTRRTLQEFSRGVLFDEDALIAIEEGPLTTAYVFDGPYSRSLGSGRVRLATALRYHLAPQNLQGFVPAFFYPREGWPESILGIALGSGQTFGALLPTPLQRMDIVDISEEVVTLAFEHFARFNHGLGQDDRVTIHLDDGRHFVSRARQESYDIVSLEPPPPTDEGVYRLYSLEFYQRVREVLRDGGMLAQWLPVYLVTPEDLRGMIKTQALVFPYTFVVQAGPRDFVILSMKCESPPRLRTAWVDGRAEVFRDVLRRKPMRWAGDQENFSASLDAVLALLITGPDDIARMEASCLHTEDDQRLSYSSGDRALMRRYLGQGLDRLSFAALPVTPFDNLQQYFVDPIPVGELEELRAEALSQFGVVAPRRLAAAKGSFVITTDPQIKARTALTVAEIYAGGHRIDEALIWLGKAVDSDPVLGDADSLETTRRLVRSQCVVFGDKIREWIAARPDDQRAAPLVEAAAETLRGCDEREAARRSRYLWW